MVYLFGIVFFTGLCALSWIDIKTFRLPNALNLALLILGLLQAYILTQDIKLNLLGVVLGYGAFVVIEKGFKFIKNKDGLGRGDAKLLAVGGAWCGAFGLPVIVLIASVSAIIGILFFQKDRHAVIPFGPFLSAAMFIVWVLGQAGSQSFTP